jgi:hypothetical protein
MKKILLFGLVLLYALPSKAQTTTNLPDSPQPKHEGRTPDVAENSLRAKASRYPDNYDPLHVNDGHESWSRAMLQPSVLVPSAVLVGLTSIQLVKTDRCISENKPACNLIFRKNRAAAYGVNIPLTAGLIWFAAREEQKGNGTTGLVTTLLALIGEAPVAYTANSHVLVCKTGRTPQCQ